MEGDLYAQLNTACRSGDWYLGEMFSLLPWLGHQTHKPSRGGDLWGDVSDRLARTVWGFRQPENPRLEGNQLPDCNSDLLHSVLPWVRGGPESKF